MSSNLVVPILHQASTRSVVTMLLAGQRSRVDLSRQTGLSKQTMSDAIRSLENAGWVRNAGVTTGNLGRSAVLYEIDARVGAVLAIDAGASRCKLVLSDVLGRPLAKREMRADALDAMGLLNDLQTLALELVREAADGRPLKGACLATPGVVNPDTGYLTLAPNLPALAGVDLVAILGDALGCPISVENDINAAVLGERWQGRARDCDFAAYMGLGTGVGLGLVAGGHLMRGATGAAGEVSYLPLGQDSLAPQSIERGALESALGIPGALAEFYGPGSSTATIQNFVAALEAGDERARRALAAIGELGALLALSVQAMFDPEVVVVGGRLGLIDPVFREIALQLALRTSRQINLVPGALGLEATVTGATFVAVTDMYNRTFSTPGLPRDWPLPVPQPSTAESLRS